MTEIIHVWHEGSAGSVLLLVLTVASTTALAGLHLWLVRATKRVSLASQRQSTTEGELSDELRALRRQRAQTRMPPKPHA